MKHSDEKLYELCKKYGQRARLWRQKFVGLLPEVFKRRLYEKKGFGSIFEFAAKLAAINKESVRLVLNLEKRFEDKPILKSLLEEGEVSVHKLARIVSVATSDNQLFWAAQAKILPKSALETLVRDEKTEKTLPYNFYPSSALDIQDGLQKPQTGQKSLPGQRSISQTLHLSPEVTQKLLELQNKGIDINALILEMLQKREQEIEEEKKCIAEDSEKHIELDEEAALYGVPIKKSRYIPVVTRELLTKEYGTKCAVPQCKKDAEEIHHTNRFALAQNHNPYFLAPLCKNHHRIAHSIDVKFQEAAKHYAPQ